MQTMFIRNTIFFIASCCSGVAFAHHSFAMFDFSKDITLAGEIKEFKWANPHIHIYLNVTDNKGEVQVWEIEGATPNSLRPQGWSKDTIQAGEKISLVVHPLKNGSAGGSLVRAYRADGTVVGARRPEEAPTAATSPAPAK